MGKVQRRALASTKLGARKDAGNLGSHVQVDPRDAHALEDWFEQNARPLPWRESRDPYRIWLSEVMLQQTTVKAVVPYYEKFLKRFPDVAALAAAPTAEVLELWAGLGYYSRARKLHESAQRLAEVGFPRTAAELETLPGFGPYTSRAVASIAFGERVGVLDGNVIRVLSRRHGRDEEWWKPKVRDHLQTLADAYAQQSKSPTALNQALMELGATVCTPQSPSCWICPWSVRCVAHLSGKATQFPRAKPRRAPEMWLWRPRLLISRTGKVGLVPNDYAPFLKGALLPPGEAQRISKKPTRFALKHSITHHQIFVEPESSTPDSCAGTSDARIQWLQPQEIPKWNPSSLLKKLLEVSSLLALTVGFWGCSSRAPQDPPPQEPLNSRLSMELSGDPMEILPAGEHGPVAFSPNGKSLYFVSKKSDSRWPQVFELDVARKLSRRLTYQNGQIAHIAALEDGSILFTSDSELRKDFTQALAEYRSRRNPLKESRSLYREPAQLQVFSIRSHGREIAELKVDPLPYQELVPWRGGEWLSVHQDPGDGGRVVLHTERAVRRILPQFSRPWGLRTRGRELWFWQHPEKPEEPHTLWRSQNLGKPELVLSLRERVSNWQIGPGPDHLTILVEGLDPLRLYNVTEKCWAASGERFPQGVTDLALRPDDTRLALRFTNEGRSSLRWWPLKLLPCTPPSR